jgi:tRNA dimethylallyltransferase
MLPVMRAHGVPGLLAHLRGEISLEDAIARGQADTRRYAKRQLTWFRHQMPGWNWVAPQEGRAAILAALDPSGRAGPK